MGLISRVSSELTEMDKLINYSSSEDDELYSSSDTSSDDEITAGLVISKVQNRTKTKNNKNNNSDSDDSDGEGTALKKIVKGKYDIGIKDLPAPDDIECLVKKCEEMKVTTKPGISACGRLRAIFDEILIIESISPDDNVLDETSLLFLSKELPLGHIFETFGSVQIPMRSSDIKSLHNSGKLIVDETLVYNFPDLQDMTKFVFTQKLAEQKGTDASWQDDQECPIEFQEFSDDEQERAMKKAAKGERQEKARKRKLEASMLEA